MNLTLLFLSIKVFEFEFNFSLSRGYNIKLQYLRFCLFEMYVNVVFVIKCL